MIGTIIIAVLGYGTALFWAAAMVHSFYEFMKTPDGSPQERRNMGKIGVSIVIAVTAAAVTRALTGW